ncbi:MAG: TPM domain-containing protein [Microcystis sp.]|uniref:TPM domain-containing protein n=1 Tax=Microcystis sp. TaxID=1127 RepID=UPI00391D0CF5|nr:TPM domain-containing protein [Microcystis aeruginosa LG13-13]NCR02716.1 TPM domain-containing protein [Microcystis aeruginosa LG13-03]NCR61109.1 TPM domain-containing protein [Microcystis aeruginosa LG11-05]
MKALVVKPHPVIWLSSLCVAFFLVPCPGLALTVQEVPNPRQVSGGWVTDKAEILQPETETQLNQMIARLEAKNGAEIAVVTVPETAPAASPKEFTTNLFNYWKIGKKGQDNGVLFLISVKDRRVEIETGYGVEGILPDGKVGNIIKTQITPRFRQKDFDGGTLAGTRAIIVSLEPSLSKELTQDTPQNNSRGVHFWMWLGVAIGGGLVIFYLIYRISLYLISSGSIFSGGDSSSSSFSGGDSGGSSFSGGDSGGSSFSGGDSGGSSFGGGDSGGGGAGDSW